MGTGGQWEYDQILSALNILPESQKLCGRFKIVVPKSVNVVRDPLSGDIAQVLYEVYTLVVQWQSLPQTKDEGRQELAEDALRSRNHHRSEYFKIAFPDKNIKKPSSLA